MNPADKVRQAFGDKATAEQIEALVRVIIDTHLSVDEAMAWKKKAGVERFSDMSTDIIQKCIDFLKRRVR